MSRIAALSRRLPAFGVDPLNRGYIAEQTVPRMTHHLHQQPRNRIRIKRIHMRGRFSDDLAAISQLPGRPGGVVSDYFIFPVMQLGVGSLEYPIELAIRASLAGIDLRPGRVRVEDNFFARRNLNRIRNVGWCILSSR